MNDWERERARADGLEEIIARTDEHVAALRAKLQQAEAWTKEMYTALNQVPNTRLFGQYRNTYELLAAYDKRKTD